MSPLITLLVALPALAVLGVLLVHLLLVVRSDDPRSVPGYRPPASHHDDVFDASRR